jgi:glycosyltransferase 2 family protein
MRKYAEYIWPLIGLAAVVGSFYLLYHEFKGEQSVGAEVWADLKAIPTSHYFAAAGCTLLAYFSLAWYDRIALLHLGVTHISWAFISLCSFTTYALSHNIGASVFSGAMVRYRAYSTKGLSAADVAVLVVLCSFTFGFGNVVLGGALLTYDPGLLARLSNLLPAWLANPHGGLVAGLSCLAFVLVYVIGSLMHFKPRRFYGLTIVYPRPGIMLRQLFAAPLELVGAAGIIYFALPESATSSVGYLVILGAFLFSFVVALLSHAPGGLGVFELIFVTIMPDVPRVKILSALLVWRLFYLIIPLLFALVVVAVFERGKLSEALRSKRDGSIGGA